MGASKMAALERRHRLMPLAIAPSILMIVVLINSCGTDDPALWCPQAGLSQAPIGLADPALQETFEDIYDTNRWGREGNGSGPGSSVGATFGIRRILYQTIQDLGIQSLLDVPCGAMAWMPLLLEEVERSRPGFRYLGLDIARGVVATNQRLFAGKHPNWQFDAFDLSAQPLPEGYDLIHTRDALQHLGCKKVVRCLRNIAESDAKYLLVGSYVVNGTNKNIHDGQYFHIDLRKSPFSLPQPSAVFSEGMWSGGDLPKFMLLYEIEALREVNYDVMSLRCSFPHACPDCP